MARAKPLLLALAGAAILIVLFVVLRPDDEAEPRLTPAPPPPTATATETEPTTATETEPPPPPQPPPPPPIESIVIHVRGGSVLGGLRRATVDRRERVRLRVSADVSDHVHLHGYDIMRDVAPGSPAVIEFRATTVGRFEVELEDRGLQIAEIEVRP